MFGRESANDEAIAVDRIARRDSCDGKARRVFNDARVVLADRSLVGRAIRGKHGGCGGRAHRQVRLRL